MPQKRTSDNVKIALITLAGSVIAAVLTTIATVHSANLSAVASAQKAKEFEESARRSAEEASLIKSLLRAPTFFPKEIHLGQVPMTPTQGNVSEGITFSLPNDVPRSAKYIYALTTIRTGDAQVSGEGFIIVTSVAREGSEKLYSYVSPFGQSAYSYASNSAWMPISEDRKITARYVSDTQLPSDASATARVFVIAYR